MVQFALFIVKPQQQRTYFPALAGVTEAAYNAIGSTDALDLAHCCALARGVGTIDLLGDYAVEAAGGKTRHPALRLRVIARRGREPYGMLPVEFFEQPFQLRSPSTERLASQ